MSLWERVKRIVRANTRPLTERQDDPETSLRLLEEELSSNQQKIQRSLEEAYVAVRQLEKQRDAFEEEAARWQEKAMQAVRAGDDELARDALHAKARAEEKAATIREEMDLHQQSTSALKDAHKQLQEQIVQAQRHRTRLEDRLRSQKAMKLMQDTARETSSQAEESDFQRIAREIETQEEQAALDAKEGKTSEMWFDQQLQAKETAVRHQQQDADAALAALKARMKK